MDNEIIINGTHYVTKTEAQTNTEGLPFVIVRTYSAGVHMGYLKKRESTLAGVEVELVNTRRIYKWSGAMTLSQLALEGTTKPEDCNITVEIPSIELVAIEIIKTTKESFDSLQNVKIWKV